MIFSKKLFLILTQPTQRLLT